jgi:hypothetical protein
MSCMDILYLVRRVVVESGSGFLLYISMLNVVLASIKAVVLHKNSAAPNYARPRSRFEPGPTQCDTDASPATERARGQSASTSRTMPPSSTSS